MKKINLYTSLLLLCFGLFLGTSCSSDTNKKPKQKVTKPANKKVNPNNTKKVTANKPARTKKLPAYNKLKKLSGVTPLVVDKINGTLVKGKKTPIAVKGNKVIITGWAIDKLADKTAGGVYIEIAGKLFAAKYGEKRGGVAKMLKNKNLVNSGFNAEIPTSSIGKGTHTLKIHAVTHNMQKVYSPNKGREIKITIP